MQNSTKSVIQARRREIILGRLHGESTSSLAAKMGVSSECVAKAIRGLPKRPVSNSGNAVIMREAPAAEETICRVCMEYLDGQTEDALMRKYKMSKDTLLSCFYAVTDRISCYNFMNQQSFVYRKVEKQREDLNVSLAALAYRCGLSPYLFRETMRGWVHLPFDAACSISDMLGISITDIISDAVIPVSGKKNRYNKSALLQRRAKKYFVEAVGRDQKSDISDAVYWAFYRYKKSEEGV